MTFSTCFAVRKYLVSTGVMDLFWLQVRDELAKRRVCSNDDLGRQLHGINVMGCLPNGFGALNFFNGIFATSSQVLKYILPLPFRPYIDVFGIFPATPLHLTQI